MHQDQYSSVQSLLDDTSFREWVLKGSHASKWESWCKSRSENPELAKQARHLLLAIGMPDNTGSIEETETALEASWQKIRAAGKPKTRLLGRWQWYAAAITLMVSGAFFYALYNPESTLSKPLYSTNLPKYLVRDLEFVNRSRVPAVINLSDGSSVLLQPGARLTYPKSFTGNTREVHLTGEAFFEIAKNRKIPFLVFTQDLVTTVTGTSFRIKASSDQSKVEVSVKTGQVNVSTRQKTNNEKITLKPNETVSFLRDRNLFQKHTTEREKREPIELLSFEFSDAPVATIFSTIQKAYGITIVYPEASLRDCYLSTSLTDEPLLEKMRIICESLGGDSRFKMQDKELIVESTGCN